MVALDIDGTMGQWHQSITQFAELYLGKSLPPYEEMKQESLFKHWHISKATYRQVKLAFRQSGLKRSMPAYPNAAGLTRSLRREGADVWICTTRPYLRLDNIDPDTRTWLRRVRVQHDGVLYGEHKYRQLVRNVGADKVVGVLDDLPELCGQAFSVGVEPLLVRRPHNQHLRCDCPQVDSLFEAEELLLKRIGDWRNARVPGRQ